MEIQQAFELFLQDNNISYEKHENEFFFSIEGNNYMLLLDDEDSDYYRLTLPKVGVPSNISQERLNEILVRLTSEFKVAKVVNTGNAGIWLSYEQILRCGNMNDCSYIFSRSIKILSEMFDRYKELIGTLLTKARLQDEKFVSNDTTEN